jgi:cytochrome c-type biogenesis protein CcmH/NrfG
LRPTHFQAEAAKQLLIKSWTDLGIQRSEAGRLSQAHEAFLEAARLDPTNADLQRNVAISEGVLKESGLQPSLRP